MYKKGFTPTTNRALFGKRAKRGVRLVWGFTLLEMIVAVGVFSVAVLIAVSSFLVLQDTEKRTQRVINLQNNLRFALEIMAKEIRTGEIYHCGDSSGEEALDCMAGASSLTFKNALGQTVIYRKIGSSVQKSSDGGDVFQAITASDISIEDLTFYVTGSPSGDDLQPRVTIGIKASSQVGRNLNELNLQTTVSQRKLSP